MKYILLVITASAALLSACGGSDDAYIELPPPVVTNEVPASALVSARAYTDYVGTLLARADTSVAVDITKATPPTSETDLPVAI